MKIGITGPFADSNFGDYGMLVNNIYALGDIDRVEVFSYDDSVVGAVWDRYLPDISHARVGVEFLLEPFDELWTGGRSPTALEILESVSNLAEIESAIDSVDVLVVNGGGYWNELWCQPHRLPKLVTILVPVLIAQLRGVRIVFTSNGFGPFGARSRFLQDLFGGLDAEFHVRDLVRSPAELRRIGVRESRVHYAPDDLFYYEPRLLEMDSSDLNLPSNYVVFETYKPVVELEAMKEALSVFNRQMGDRGLSVVVLPFYGGRGGGVQSEWLERELGWQRVSFNEAGFLALETARSVIRGAEAVICERYHAAIVALSNGVPVVHALRDVSGDKQYYYAKSLGAAYTAWGPTPSGNPHIAMATSLQAALLAVGQDFEETTAAQIGMHRSVSEDTVAEFKRLRSDVIGRIKGIRVS